MEHGSGITECGKLVSHHVRMNSAKTVREAILLLYGPTCMSFGMAVESLSNRRQQ